MDKKAAYKRLVEIGVQYPEARPLLRPVMAALKGRDKVADAKDGSFNAWVVNFQKESLTLVEAKLPPMFVVEKRVHSFQGSELTLSIDDDPDRKISVKFSFQSIEWMQDDPAAYVIFFGPKRKSVPVKMSPSTTPSQLADQILSTLKTYA